MERHRHEAGLMSRPRLHLGKSDCKVSTELAQNEVHVLLEGRESRFGPIEPCRATLAVAMQTSVRFAACSRSSLTGCSWIFLSASHSC